MSEDSLFDTIRRLLALGTNSNEHEAAAAMAKAYELCARHNVEMSHARSREGDDWEEVGGWRGGGTIPYHVHLAWEITESFFFVRVVRISQWRQGRRTMELAIFGRKENVAVAQHVLAFLIRSFWQLWKAQGQPAKYRRAYQLGLAQGLASRLHKERSHAASRSAANALVVSKKDLDREFEARNTGTKSVRGPGRLRTTSAEEIAIMQGRADGAKIAIRPAIPNVERLMLPAD